MTASAVARLPGVRFEDVAPAAVDALPRMDIAVFVGLAERGPIDAPVPIEDAAQFEHVFGADVALAWDADRGERAHGHLAGCVRSFFANGGRRCWVIRVAGRDARANVFALPGVLAIGDDGADEVTPAFARARSAGSWSDPLRVACALRATPIPVSGLELLGNGKLRVDTTPATRALLRTGDSLRIRCKAAPEGSEVLLFAAVESISLAAGSPPAGASALCTRFLAFGETSSEVASSSPKSRFPSRVGGSKSPPGLARKGQRARSTSAGRRWRPRRTSRARCC